MKKVIITLINLISINYVYPQEIIKEATENISNAQELQNRTDEIEKILKKLQNIKISGYIQGQFQSGQKDASLNIGESNENKNESFNRFGIRRGRLKITYEEKLTSAVFQLDMTEAGIAIKDAYFNVKDPWIKTNSLQVGIFNRPFGNEISYSSSLRESPERSLITRTIFPNERDLGTMITLQPSKTSYFNFLKLEAGLFAGNSTAKDNDNRKDFIGHLIAQKSINEETKITLGTSYYLGSVYQGTDNVFKIQNDKFIRLENKYKGGFSKREYFGLDTQISTSKIWGMTQLRAEYLFGKQPGIINSSSSPRNSTLLTSDIFLRYFQGGYIIFIQDLGKFPVSLIAKYDWYDPNTKVKSNQIGAENSNTSQTDLAYNTFGLGGLYRINQNLRLQVYYDIINNEKTENIKNYESDKKDNLLTLRLQYKF